VLTLETAVKEFLGLKRIAVAGVSRQGDGEAANGIYKKLRDSGYEVFAVNPNAETVEGDPCYPNVGSIPGGVEGVVIVTAPAATEQVVRDCAAAGIKRVWMHKGMGSSVSDDAVQFCQENGITVIPGACPMMFCQPVDVAHACIRMGLGLFGKLPQPV